MKTDKLITWCKQVYLFFDNKIIFYILKKIYSFAGQRIRKRQDKYSNGHGNWREQTIEDFKVWLSQVESLPDFKPDETLNECDLFTLLAQFASLKKQIEIQNREQSRNIRSLKNFNEFAQQGYDMISLLDEKIEKLNTMEEKIKEKVQIRAVKVFLDVRDPLVRGMESGEKTSFLSFIFGIFGKKKLNTIMEGYEMALKKFDLALAMLDTFPIDTKDAQFDAGTMMAVDTMHKSTAPKGMVINEISGGFICKDKVIRPAQVMVNK